ncbi:hypothetical protein [Micromonospora halophytica]|uniref:Uncharacterized protein n=1 Tax=Micromonospora halophytica TaxID=47864 RepID=A0A1C5I0D5_9ACTN|nr:hypothetical protein [Micromonospora halophytica]SCG51361.1 hypothetical protein GA0070560_1072 [Micromonospora halophytica]
MTTCPRLTSPARPTTDPAALALLRRGLVAPGLLAGSKRRERGTPLPTETGVRALEADALSLGYVVGARLRAYLCRQEPARLAALGSALLTGLATLVGAHVPHLPLFKDFDGGFRPSLWEVACWYAAARAERVQVRADGVRTYRRQPGESLRDFAARLTHLGPAEETSAGQPQPATFAALVRGDAPVRDAARVYALHPDGPDTTRIRRHTAADLVAQLAPVD